MAEKRFFFLCLLAIVLARSFSPVRAELSGRLKYSFENNYLNQSAVQQLFTQDYTTYLRGAVREDRIGSYQLELHYQKGAAELKSFTFSNTLNFRDSVRLTTYFYRREFGNSASDNELTTENRLSLIAAYYAPALPTLTFAYEKGNSLSSSAEGINKNDAKATAGFSYSFGRSSLSARYSKAVLYDNTYLSLASNFVSREDNFSFTGLTALGERVQLTGNYFDQRVTNQLGTASRYTQRLRSLSVQGELRALPHLTIKPSYSSNLNFVDYLSPSGQKEYQQSQRSTLAASFNPLPQTELSLAVGGGPLDFDGAQGSQRQTLLFRQAGFDLNLNQRLLLNISLEDNAYRGTAEGQAVNFRAYCTYSPRGSVKLTFKKNTTTTSGPIYTPGKSSLGKQDLNEGQIEVGPHHGFSFLGGASASLIELNRYNTTNYGLRYFDANRVNWEMRREDKLGTGTAQDTFSRTDSFKASLTLNKLKLSTVVSWLTNTVLTGTPTNVLYGFRFNSEVNYSLGDSSFSLIVNSERQDQNSNEYSKTYLSFTRDF